jgi:galactosamine-6-phosphate isomerase
MNPIIRVCDDHKTLSQQAAERVMSALAAKPDLLLCAAGGSTPLHTYLRLAEHHARKPELFRSLRVVKLDEWGGIEMDDSGSCEGQLRK